jgi:probable rRNA maturation factor
MLHIDFYNEVNLEIPDSKKIKRHILYALNCQRICGEKSWISIIIVPESEMKKLNHQYCDKDKVTNILSFPFEIPPNLPKEEKMTKFLGDLVVCPNQISIEAREQNKIIEHHWYHIIIHGILHLVGHDHIYEQEAQEMESLEISLLSSLNIGNPYCEKK